MICRYFILALAFIPINMKKNLIILFMCSLCLGCIHENENYPKKITEKK